MPDTISYTMDFVKESKVESYIYINNVLTVVLHSCSYKSASWLPRYTGKAIKFT